MNVKDWKKAQSGIQFEFIAPNHVRRLIDGEVFSGNVPYIYSSSTLPEFITTITIESFADDKIHVKLRFNDVYGDQGWYQTAEINRLVKTNSSTGVPTVYLKAPGKPRRKIKK